MRSVVRRALVAALGTGLLLAGLAPVPAAAAAPPLELRTPLTAVPSDTELVAASGSSILGWAYGTYQLSNDFGKTWRRIEPGLYWDAATPDYVAKGRAAFTVADRAVVVNLDSGEARKPDLSGLSVDVGDFDGPIVATSDRHAIVRNGDNFAISAYSGDLVAGQPVAIKLDPLPAVAGNVYADLHWKVDHLFGYRLRSFGSGSVTDVDLFGLDGSAGPAAFRVPGEAYAIEASDATHLQYLYRAPKSVQRCTRNLATATTSCHSILAVPVGSWTHADRQGDAIVLSVYNRYWYVCRETGGAACTMRAVSPPKNTWFDNHYGTLGDPKEPLLLGWHDDLHSIYSLTAARSLVKRSDPLKAPRIPEVLSLTPGQLVGADLRASSTAWRRPVTDRIGRESVLSTKTDEVVASAGRAMALTNGEAVLYDRGNKTGAIKKTTALIDMTGPYPTITKADATYVGVPLTTLRKVDGLLSVYGSRVLKFVKSALEITDLVDAAVHLPVPTPPIPTEEYHYLTGVQLKGDWVVATYLGFVIDDEGARLESDARVLNIATAGATWSDAVAGEPAAVGDGFAVLVGSDQAESRVAAWNFTTGGFTPLEAPAAYSAIAADGTRVAYATETDLVIREIPGIVRSAPGVLGMVAPSGCNAWNCSWSPQIDTSKALTAGVIKIRSAGGATVRSLATEASDDGSLRRAVWDGKLDGGGFAPPGRYSWVLEAKAADGSGPVVAIDGSTVPGGSLSVTQAFVGKAKVTSAKVSDATPHVGDVLHATAVAVPADASLAYTWYAGSTKRVGASDGTYTVASTDLGKKLKVVATATRPGYSKASKTSARTKAVGRGTFSVGKLSLTGTASFPGEVTATPGAWKPEPSSVRFQWYRVDGSHLRVISGATSATYALQAADVGFTLQVVATAKAPGYVDGVQRLRTPKVMAG